MPGNVRGQDGMGVRGIVPLTPAFKSVLFVATVSSFVMEFCF